MCDKNLKTIYIENLGCSKNLVDSERILGVFLRNKFNLTYDPEKASIIIVNTCSFIQDSREEAINTIFELLELKSKNLKTLIVTGCLVESNEEELKKEFIEIDYIVNNRNLVEMLNKLSFDVESEENYYNNRELLYSNNNFAYLKISEGCNRRCSFCTIPIFKGNLISRDVSSLVEESKILVNKGVKELILVAQDITDYGSDINKNLVSLLREIIKLNGLQWIRLLYTYPTSITDDLIEIISDSDKICSYIDIPFQHIDDNILKNMKREGNKRTYNGLIEKLRNKIPNIAIRSTFIVGFPGETNDAFNKLYNWVNEVKLDRVGVFSYSYEENTMSARLKGHIPEYVKEQRRKILMELQEGISTEKLKNRVGKEYQVLVEEKLATEGSNDLPYLLSRSQYEAPEVDGNIVLRSKKVKVGEFCNVKIIESLEHDLLGKVID